MIPEYTSNIFITEEVLLKQLKEGDIIHGPSGWVRIDIEWIREHKKSKWKILSNNHVLRKVSVINTV